MRPKVAQPFPLSKLMDPQVDFPLLAKELRVVEAYDALRDQHPLRAWEYAMAHKAIGDWQEARDATPMAALEGTLDPLQLCDVGGAGSRFYHSLLAVTSEDIWVIDPAAPPDPAHGQWQIYQGTVESFAATNRHNQFDALTCISVIEHVPNLRAFFRACHMLLKPGGLLFLTTDCWNCEGPDTAHFHWMRERIYNPGSLQKLTGSLRELGFKSFGASDWAYKGDHLYGSYSFASIAMVRG